jgi:hypothetical protein
MDQSQHIATVESRSPTAETSLATQAFGIDRGRYRAFLEALLDGWLEYEMSKGGSDHAPHPIPAA